jgi:cytochrome c
VKLFAIMLACGLLAAGTVHAQDASTLLEKYKCNACHGMTEPKTGPAYVDVAARYRGDPKAASALADAIRRGAHGSGPWHMPPHPEISEADARKMVRYILALKG